MTHLFFFNFTTSGDGLAERFESEPGGTRDVNGGRAGGRHVFIFAFRATERPIERELVRGMRQAHSAPRHRAERAHFAETNAQAPGCIGENARSAGTTA